MARPFHHHEFNQDSVNEQQVVFRCAHCDRSIGFWLPPSDKGPTAVKQDDGTYAISDADNERGGAIDNTIGVCDK